MASLLITNVEEGTSDDEIQAFLAKYGLPPFDAIERVPGSGERPAVLLKFDALSAPALRPFLPRIHNVYWKQHTITALVMREPTE